MGQVAKSYYSVGNLVTLKASFLGEPVGVIAFVYEEYGTAGGISLITQNGRDLGGFSLEEQWRWVEWYGDTGKVYHFKNVIDLGNDWRRGYFKPIFDYVEKFKISLHEREARRANH